MVEVAGPTIHDESLDADLRSAFAPLAPGQSTRSDVVASPFLGNPSPPGNLSPTRIEAVWFLSKHAAASGQPSLTVHPIGNPGPAKFGGQPGFLCPTAPRDMGRLLRALAANAREAKLPHAVTFEATHHGPAMTLPSLFVEIGSDQAWYEDATSGQAGARAILDSLSALHAQAGNPSIPAIPPAIIAPSDVLAPPPRPIFVGVGGGHYMPRATDLALSGRADFGHLLPSHAWAAAESDDQPPEPGAVAALLQRAWQATPGATAVHLHKKGMKGPLRSAVRGALDQLALAAHDDP